MAVGTHAHGASAGLPAPMVRAVRSVLDDHVVEGGRLLVACSGGPDSTALLHLTAAARPDLALVVGHVRHGLRDDAADAAAARAHADALGLPLHVRRVQVRPAGEGVEAAARRARYDALASVADEVGATAIAVGHTADDQAETVLLNVARGTGVRGLAGMAELRACGPVEVVRPLLGLRRAAVRAVAAGTGQAVVQDPTNDDPSQRRARARHEVLPALGRLVPGDTGDAVGALTRLARLARSDADALDELAAEAAGRVVERWGPVRCVRRAELGGLPPALATRVLRGLIAEVGGGGAGPPARAIERCLALAPGQAMHVPGGVLVTAGGGWLAAAPPDLRPLPERALHLPGSTPLPEIGCRLGVVTGPTSAALSPPQARGDTSARTWHSPDGAALVVRARRPGDRLPLRAGSRSLQDLLVDAGVPRPARDLVPVIATAEGAVRWVPGIAATPSPGPPAGTRLGLQSLE
jgi:tRNA(Ile)-lysidine synthase